MALIIGSIFYGTPDATIGFYSKGSVLFLGVLMNALTAISEINSLYDQRPIVEKHNSYAFYHPWTEAAAGVVADLPVKFVIAVVFNVVSIATTCYADFELIMSARSCISYLVYDASPRSSSYTS